jgi:parallel beta-helix repeat protein
MKRFVRFLPVFALAVIVAIPAWSAEGRTPVWTDGTIIGADGAYIVTRDIIGAGIGPVITIAAVNVTLDLNGFTIEETAGGFPVIDIVAPAVEVTIKNGTLVRGTQGINLATGVTTRTVIIEDVEFKDNGTDAIFLEDVRNVEIRRNRIIDAGGGGIIVASSGAAAPFKNGHIEENTVNRTGPGFDGILVERSAAMSIRHNRVETPGGSGIRVADAIACLIGENQISDADGEGISLEFARGCKVYNNVVNRGETNGIFIDPGSEDNFILDNVVRESGLGGSPGFPGLGGSGILVLGRRNHIERNTINFNDGCGLNIIGSDNTFGRNMARANDPSGSFFCGGAACGALAPPNSCDAGLGNTSFGDNFIPFLL